MATQSTITRHENGDITLAIAIPWITVKKIREAVLDEIVTTSEIQGFRKGKAPRELVEKQINPQKFQEEVLRKVLPEAYIQAVGEHKLQPLVNPKIHVDKLEEEKDWKFEATTCEMPEINLGIYKDEVKKITAKSKIIIPGKKPEEVSFDVIMNAILSVVKISVPHMLVEQEVDRLLSQTLDEIKKLGLTLDQYLQSTKKSPEQLRSEYGQKAENDIKIELILQKIAETEKITVEEKEISEAIEKAKDAKEKQYLEGNKYMLASILRQQKTLDFLKNL